jgi:hypothetical protein
LASPFSLNNATALITGASAGLGSEFARQLAPQARCLMLVARREAELANVRDTLKRLNPALEVIIFPADLAAASDRRRVVELIEREQVPINLLVNNAGLGDYGPFETAESSRIQSQIDVNITALVQLTHALLPTLRAHRPAGILNVSSLAAELPLPGMSVYAATKAFVTSFSEALRIELQADRIHVTAVSPGPTPTTFSMNAHRRTGSDTNRSGQSFLRLPPEVVVSEGLKAVVRNTAVVYPGWSVAFAARCFRSFPRSLLHILLAKRYRAETLDVSDNAPS